MLRLLLPALRDAPFSLRIHGWHPRGVNPLAAASQGQPSAAVVLRPGLRLLSTSTAASDYLVDTWGLSSAQARKAAKHLTCRSNANAVRAHLLDVLGLSKAAAAKAVATKPQLLHCSVKDTLAPCVAELKDLWSMMSHEAKENSRLIASCPELLVSRLHVSRLRFYKSQFKLTKYQILAVLSAHPRFLDHNTDEVALNAAFLKRFLENFRDEEPEPGSINELSGGFILRGSTQEVHEIFVLAPRLFTATSKEFEAIVARAKERGGGDTFGTRLALVAGHPLCREGMSAKAELLESFGFSTRQVGGILFSLPAVFVMSRSEEKLRSTVDFFTKEAGWELDKVARSWILFQRSVDRRLRPFFKVFNILREQGLLEEAIARCQELAAPRCECDETEELDDFPCDETQESDPLSRFTNTSNRQFEEAFVCPYEESIPALTDAYAAARASPSRW